MSPSTGVPSGCFSRYFMSQIWREISLIASFPNRSENASERLKEITPNFRKVNVRSIFVLKRVSGKSLRGKGLAAFSHELCGSRFDVVLKPRHEFRPFQSRRDRGQEFDHHLAGLLEK